MYVCVCNAVTDHAIRDAVTAGVVSFEQLRFELGVSRNCGRCEQHARAVMAEALASRLPDRPARVRLPGAIPA